MEQDDISSYGLWDYRTLMPENFLDKGLWKRFIDSFNNKKREPFKYMAIKMEVQTILLTRFLDARGKKNDEEVLSRNDLIEWLTMYPFSLAIIAVKKALKEIEDFQERKLVGQDILLSTIIPDKKLLDSGADESKLGSHSLVRALYLYQPRKESSFDAYMTVYIGWSVEEAMKQHRHPSADRDRAIAYNKAVNNFRKENGRDPESDEELANHAKKHVNTIKRWHDAAVIINPAENLDDDEKADSHETIPDVAVASGLSAEDLANLSFFAEIVQNEFSIAEQMVYFGRLEGMSFEQIFLQDEALLKSPNNCRKIFGRKVAPKLMKALGEK